MARLQMEETIQGQKWTWQKWCPNKAQADAERKRLWNYRTLTAKDNTGFVVYMVLEVQSDEEYQ
jgi:hypothetical protein